MGEDSDLYRTRVLGEFPRRAQDQLFPLATLDEAVEGERTRPTAHPAARLALGVDVARYGSDARAFSWIADGLLTSQVEYHGLATTETAGRIVAELQRRPDLAVAIDDTGVGGGVTDAVREQGWEPLAVNFGAAAAERDYYANRGSEIYQALADALETGRLHVSSALPTRDTLSGQLTAVTYRVGSDGRRRVQKRGTTPNAPSPDLADSLALAWAAYVEAERGAGVW